MEIDNISERELWLAGIMLYWAEGSKQKETNVSVGINIDEDNKRYYPYNNLASQVIGFCGNDNQGLDGIEAKYNDELKGTNGKIA